MNGIHPAEKKEVRSAVTYSPSAVQLVLSQNCGCPPEPIVKEGDTVKKYQKVAEAKGNVSVPLHSPIAGTVTHVSDSIHIDVEGTSEIRPKRKDYTRLNQEKIIEVIRKAGVVGLGGAAFPTHVKLQTKVKTYILNGCECEPHLMADHHVMVTYPEEVITGLRILMKASGATKGIIGIEKNKPDAIQALRKHAGEGIEVRPVPTRYPQGAEKMLIHTLTGRKVPCGELPCAIDIGMNNVGTAKAVYDAFQGIPLTHRVFTVSGSVRKPVNVLAPIGTTARELINQADGYEKQPAKVLFGGPMMGVAQDSVENPVTKACSGITVFSAVDQRMAEPCIRCGRCVEVCPMHLLPTTLVKLIRNKKFADAKETHLFDCFECGSCTYVCPSNIPLVHYLRLGKQELRNACQK
ncbi:MAG: electron transport complex subunit RsxC [Nanobdellota archaeon]